ncbi:MAG: rhodanese-like domain-containing protein [Sedimentibacter sp.]|uniref:rhodanese-like domain-containing protein n=1 Tax=Sedimentibacter sp. TaxID=1960295 RepID=UPI0031596B25
MRKILLLLSVVLVAAAVLTGCGEQEEKMDTGKYKKIGAEEAKKIMDSEEVIVLDVRTQDEYDQGHIPGSVLLPVDEISAKAVQVLSERDAKILVYCRSGNRSAAAARTLIDMGYTNVYDFGGINDWPYETVK